LDTCIGVEAERDEVVSTESEEVEFAVIVVGEMGFKFAGVV